MPWLILQKMKCCNLDSRITGYFELFLSVSMRISKITYLFSTFSAPTGKIYDANENSDVYEKGRITCACDEVREAFNKKKIESGSSIIE